MVTWNEVVNSVEALKKRKNVFNEVFGDLIPGMTKYNTLSANPINLLQNQAFFLDSTGGTGNTFFAKSILAYLK